MSSTEEFLSREFWGNTMQAYLIALGVILVGLIVVRIFKRVILNKLQQWAIQSHTRIDDMIVRGLERFGLPIISFAIIYWAINSLELSAKAEKIVDIATAVVIAYFVIRLISAVIQTMITSSIRKQENGEIKIKQIGGLMIIINMVIWILGLVFLLDNLGYDVTTILTGVGIGGVAIALAAQNIVGDLFNYFVIFFDKPFEVGDAINVDDKNGSIEYIGLKTTRLRSLTGEQIIISNSDLTKSRVHNYKRQQTRRIAFNINVRFHNDPEKLKKIPGIVKAIIEAAGPTRFDRAHFARFTEYGLTFEVVYFVTVADYNKYMDIQQEINLKIMEAFKNENITFLIREDRPGEWDNN
ncbi:MAG TPA: mechanosensitive ion channel family protein [Cyclobacteriaceae bacterium]|nr:mechanosensitive ion channel family protein [Cyclobacteriaceae bacterium]HMV11192.1 mechanosensitive ion channel family protein [Cyclobacteriaceae bacterium]HMV91631.1 mechanosensitive ion channel family protein [Cyclobacteriaceae bacterium]HMX01716.1 mechanosensitive ion channel family protein [Cyclobacteriaceae bacterium]HMX51393.1 mechanosensitive ion channel family protein [Cyclobacteriaceae bacterium]